MTKYILQTVGESDLYVKHISRDGIGFLTSIPEHAKRFESMTEATIAHFQLTELMDSTGESLIDSKYKHHPRSRITP
jgi:hypothetical protein